MKSIRYHALGPPEVLQYEDAADPVLQHPDDVLVSIHAASVNAADVKARSGQSAAFTAQHFPHIPGRDFSGVVIAAGPAADLAVGEEVYGVCPQGTEGAYAQKIVLAAGLLARKPASLSHAQAAALALAGLTALIAIEDTLKLKRGEKLLVQGGAGGVGGFAIQLARHVGAHVATTARAVNHDYLRALGAQQTIDYTRADPGAMLGDRDAAFDTIGGACVAQSFSSLRKGGRAAFITGGAKPPAPTVEGVESLRPQVPRGRLYMDRLSAHVEAGVIRMPQILELPLEQAGHAHVLSGAGHVRGKIVLLPPVA